MDTREVVEQYARALDARDWEAFAHVLAADVEYVIPQTGERIAGREEYVRFNQDYPGEWHIRPVRLVAEAEHAVLWISFEVAGEQQDGIGFFTVWGDEVTHITDFWPQPYEPPQWRKS